MADMPLTAIGQGDHGDENGAQRQLGGSQPGAAGDGEGMVAFLAPPLLSGFDEVVIHLLAFWAHRGPFGFGPPQFLEPGANRFIIPSSDHREGYFACLRFEQEEIGRAHV